MKNIKKYKIVYVDGDYTKVIYGVVKYLDDFTIVKQADDRDIRLGNKYIVSITPQGD